MTTSLPQRFGDSLDGRLSGPSPGTPSTAALSQPSQSTFISFDGKVLISVAFTKRAAERLAALLASGALAAPLSP
jgi:preprotein translocase subunit SecD